MTYEHAISGKVASAARVKAQMPTDDQVFARFYQWTARPLWAYLAKVLQNPALADDLAQEAYLRFLCSARWEEGDQACRAFLYRIATNLMHDHWRRPKTACLEDVHEGDLPRADWLTDEQLDAQTRLGPALAELRPRERQLLWLAYAEGATHAEIAAITGLHSPSIRLLLFRARRRLARLLEGQVPSVARVP